MKNSRRPTAVIRPRLREDLIIHPLISFVYSIARRICQRLDDRSGLQFARLMTSALVRPFRHLRMKAMRCFFQSEEWTETECLKLDRKYLEFQGRLFRENVRLPDLSDDELRERVSLHGEEHLQSALEEGRGVLLVGTHVGNWLLMPSLLRTLGYPVSAIALEIPIRGVERHMQAIWRRYGIRIFHVGRESVREAKKALDRNEAVIIAYDASVRPGENIWSPFGDIAIGADPGPARLAQMFDVPIVRMRSRPVDDLRSELTLEKPVTVGEIIRSNPGTDLMQVWIDELHDEVRTSPELWWPWSLIPLAGADKIPARRKNHPVELEVQ